MNTLAPRLPDLTRLHYAREIRIGVGQNCVLDFGKRALHPAVTEQCMLFVLL